MTTGSRRSALAALDVARPVVARLDMSRGPEDTAADLIEAWSAVETALRSLVGGTAVGGQALIREARQRQLIGFEQANTLAELHAVRERLDRPDYTPTDADLNVARTSFLKLETALMTEAPVDAPRATAAGAAAATAAPQVEPVTPGGVVLEPTPRTRPAWLIPAIAAVILVAIGIGAYYSFFANRESASLQRGVDLYRQGQREAAVGEFTKAIRETPDDATPYVYLGRMAREVGNFTLASEQLRKAVEVDGEDTDALREMGSLLLAQGQFDLAGRFYVRAIERDSTDRAALGWYACTLSRLNRQEAAQRFYARAGQGPWSVCAQMPPAGPPGAYPPGTYPPGTYQPGAVPPQQGGYPPPAGYPPPTGYPPPVRPPTP